MDISLKIAEKVKKESGTVEKITKQFINKCKLDDDFETNKIQNWTNHHFKGKKSQLLSISPLENRYYVGTAFRK